jgi:hypothetical protein
VTRSKKKTGFLATSLSHKVNLRYFFELNLAPTLVPSALACHYILCVAASSEKEDYATLHFRPVQRPFVLVLLFYIEYLQRVYIQISFLGLSEMKPLFYFMRGQLKEAWSLVRVSYS